MNTQKLSLATVAIPLALTLTAGCDKILRRITGDDDNGNNNTANNNNNTPQVPTVTPPPVNNNGNGNNNNTGLQIPGLGNLPIPTNLPMPFPTGNNGTPNAPAGGGQVTPTASLAPSPPGSYDSAGGIALAFMRTETVSVFNELVNALGTSDRARIQGIPLRIEENLAEVNAAAGCTSSGRSFMLITSGLLVISAASSEARAYDEIANTHTLSPYYDNVAAQVRRRQPAVGNAPGTLPMPMAMDPRKLARQRYLFDQQIGFVLGHELAHHYRGHTGCANGTPAQHSEISPEDVVRILSNTVPVFNQPLELEADTWGVTDVMDAGRNRPGGTWTEEGALMSLDFFGHLTQLGVETLLLGFMRTHPPPAVRIPIVQYWANNWRSGVRPQTGGIAGLPLPIPIPLPFPQNNNNPR